MDTAYRLPFELKFYIHYNNNVIVKECIEFADVENAKDEVDTVQIEENDEVSILFNSTDQTARLYLEALDIIPTEYGITLDEDGNLYRSISPVEIPLYKINNNFDALRVDKFQLTIECDNKKYYGMLTVNPKQLDINEWENMRNDLELELKGLALDIVRRNTGLGKKTSEIMPPEHLYKFFVMKKHNEKILQALIDIQDKPRCRIEKKYQNKPAYEANDIDKVSIKHYLNKCNENEYYVPEKLISYNISENRMLKKILIGYEKELSTFIALVNTSIHNISSISDNTQYEKMYLDTLEHYRVTAIKLKKVTNIIKQAPWFKSVESREEQITHTFAMDSRYGAIYRMYRELKKKEIKINIDPMYSYSWKKSSVLYEMWCYIRLCRLFQKKYALTEDTFSLGLKDDVLVPYLKKGTKAIFQDEKVRLEVIYNKKLVRSKNQSTLQENPYYMINNHVVPDIVINIYYLPKNEMYIGSVVLECKYRKVNSFWRGTTMSSREQIQAYYLGAKSWYYFNMKGRHNVRPVQKVFVLTPDKVRCDELDGEIVLREFRPNNEMVQEQLIDEVWEVIKDRINEVERSEDED